MGKQCSFDDHCNVIKQLFLVENKKLSEVIEIMERGVSKEGMTKLLNIYSRLPFSLTYSIVKHRMRDI